MDGSAARTTFQLAQDHYAAGRLDEAATAFRRALEENGPHPDTLNRLGLIAAQRNDYAQAHEMLRRACEADGWKTPMHRQNLVAIQVALARLKIQAGDSGGAFSILQKAAAHAPEFPDLCAQVIELLCTIGHQNLHTRPAGAVAPMRTAVRLAPQRADVRNLWSHALSYSGTRAELADFTTEFGTDALAVRPLVACFPKSGSTLLKTLLCAATGFREQHLTYGYQQNEEELHLPYVQQAARTPAVTQLHCRATEPNLHILQAFAFRPVVLVRNIFDTLLSYKEFYDQGAHLNTFFRDYPALDDDQRLDLIVDDRAPWYLAFYASWHDAIARGRIEAMWLSYEELRADKRGALDAVLAFHGLDVPEERRAAALAHAEQDKQKTRYNKGVAGRGAAAFSDRHREQLARLAAYYPSVDFSRIGL